MNTKWCISALFLIIAYFGAFHEQIPIPNQEIVLEFVDTKINQKNIKSAIFDVKEKLLKVGVSNIKIQETQNGTLKISYYSDVLVDDIKKALAEEDELLLTQNSENEEENKNSSNYSIDIYDLTNETDIANSNDTFIFEIEYNSYRSLIYTSSAFLKNLEENKANLLFKTNYRASQKNSFTKDYNSYKEPEVRAGPYKYYV